MSLLLITSLLLAGTLSLPLSAAPLTLGIWILLLSFLSGAFIALKTSAWIGIITILIYVGGLNVLFAYFAATSPNKHLFIAPILRTTILASTRILINLLFYTTTLYSTITFQQTILFKKMYIGRDIPILLILGLILFLALVMVVKISNRSSGPLRPFS